MSDRRFDEIVLNPRSNVQEARARCRKCSTLHRVDKTEFESETSYNLRGEPFNPLDTDDDPAGKLEYVAKMRAWNCCCEGEEPLDGFPEEPESPYKVEFGERV